MANTKKKGLTAKGRIIIAKVNKWRSDNTRSISWLAQETQIPYGTLYAILSLQSFPFNAENKKKVEKVIKITL